MRHHALLLFDRGECHVHRWRPGCACGRWTGSNHRRRKFAVKQYTAHVAIVSRPVVLPWQVPTPSHLLPEALRSGR